jgi:hypothetical protein
MPFVQRLVEPKYITRSTYKRKQTDTDVCGDGTSAAGTQQKPLSDYELATVTNTTFSNAIKQLASLMLIANEIFTELNCELQQIKDRSGNIRLRINKLATNVDSHDPKLVTVRK